MRIFNAIYFLSFSDGVELINANKQSFKHESKHILLSLPYSELCPVWPSHSKLSESLNMCTYVQSLPCLCVCVALTVFCMTTYQLNMLHSPPDSVPALHHRLSLLSQWLQHGACDAAMLASTQPYCVISFFLCTAEKGKKCTSKNRIIKHWNSFTFIWAFRFHASHLFRAGKLI